MKFAILEIGSTNTKACIYENEELWDFGQKYIPFKDNYVDCLKAQDIQSLREFIDEIKRETNRIYAFGTSIFRKLSVEKIEKFRSEIGIEFEVVSSEQEAELTVSGVVDNIDYGGKLGVFIGGGGSTEIVIDDKKIMLDFGVVDITKRFPELKNDTVSTSFEEIYEYVLGKFDLEDSVDTLVLAGGDYIYFYEKAEYEMQNNFLYSDKNQPYLLDFERADFYDHDCLHKSFDEIRARCKGNEGWWDGARAMRFCVNAVAKRLGAKYIIPTRINMISGLVNKILKKERGEQK